MYTLRKKKYSTDMGSQSYLTDEKSCQTKLKHVSMVSFLLICNEMFIQICKETDEICDLLKKNILQGWLHYKQIIQLLYIYIFIYIIKQLKMASYLKVTVCLFHSACGVISNMQFTHHTQILKVTYVTWRTVFSSQACHYIYMSIFPCGRYP